MSRFSASHFLDSSNWQGNNFHLSAILPGKSHFSLWLVLRLHLEYKYFRRSDTQKGMNHF